MILIENHYWRYAFFRAYFNLLGEASRYYLGWLWWFLEPVAMTGVFYVVFTYIRPSGMENFTLFILTRRHDVAMVFERRGEFDGESFRWQEHHFETFASPS